MGLAEQLAQAWLGLRAEAAAQPTLIAKLKRLLAVLRVIFVRPRAFHICTDMLHVHDSGGTALQCFRPI